MKKPLLLAVLLLLGLALLTACGAPEPTEPDPSPSEVPTDPPPTWVAPTPVPTITPMPMEGVEWPEEGATLLSIDPIDKPTRPPIIFEPYQEWVSPEIGVRFEYPAYWLDPVYDDATGILTIREPENDIRSGTGVASEVTIMMQELSTAQTEKDAQSALDAYLDYLRGIHPSLTASSSDTNSMMGSAGRYVTYRIDYAISEDESVAPLKMRGRCLVIPKDKRLYTIQYLCPADWNSDYVNVYYELRSTMEEL